jgi:hypothetical protein
MTLATAAVFLCLSSAPARAAADDTANFETGLAYYNQNNADQAARVFWRLAGTGDPRAQYYLGTMMSTGKGTSKDAFGAFGWMLKSAAQGYTPAMTYLGYAFSAGYGVTANQREAYKWYVRAAKRGDAAAQNSLGIMCRDGGDGCEKNPKLAAQLFLLSALQGNPRAQYNLATMNLLGQGMRVNYKEAARWYEAAAKQNDMYAQNALATMYRFGMGVDRDPAKALELYQSAAEQGHADSIVSIAKMYENAEGDSTKGPSDVALWYAKAANKGNVEAMHKLASFYEKGVGVLRDINEAARWYKKAGEENGYAPSRLALAHLYETGSGVEKDLNKARDIYQKGAEAGDPYSQLALGRLYKAGQEGDLRADPVLAYQWLALAANALPNGEDKNSAVVARIETANAMSETQLNDARQKVSTWKPTAQ